MRPQLSSLLLLKLSGSRVVRYWGALIPLHQPLEPLPVHLLLSSSPLLCYISLRLALYLRYYACRSSGVLKTELARLTIRPQVLGLANYLAYLDQINAPPKEAEHHLTPGFWFDRYTTPKGHLRGFRESPLNMACLKLKRRYAK